MEPLKQIADSTLLLSYITNLFLTFIIAITGAFVREVYMYKRHNVKLSIYRLLGSGILVAVANTAIIENVDIQFSIFSLMTFLFGMWAFNIIEILMNVKYIAIVTKDILKELGSPLLKGTSNAIEDVRKEMKEEQKDKQDKEESKDKKEDVKDKKEKSSNENNENEHHRSEDKKDKKITVPPDISNEELLKQIRKLEAELAKQIENEESDD